MRHKKGSSWKSYLDCGHKLTILGKIVLPKKSKIRKSMHSSLEKSAYFWTFGQFRNFSEYYLLVSEYFQIIFIFFWKYGFKNKIIQIKIFWQDASCVCDKIQYINKLTELEICFTLCKRVESVLIQDLNRWLCCNFYWSHMLKSWRFYIFAYSFFLCIFICPFKLMASTCDFNFTVLIAITVALYAHWGILICTFLPWSMMAFRNI